MASKYLFWLAQEGITMRVPELQSLVSMLKPHLKWIFLSQDHSYAICESTDVNTLINVARRSVLVRFLFQVWGQGSSLNDLNSQIKNGKYIQLSENTSLDKSFELRVESYGKKLTSSQKLLRIHNYDYLPFEGPVKLDNPDNSYYHIEYYGTDELNVPDEPYEMFFGKLVSIGGRRLLFEYSLSNRKFISMTSMDPMASFVMSNLAKVQAGDLVYDPFCGSGSLLVSAGVFGAKVFGSDINYLLLHGKTKPCRAKVKARDPDECNRANFIQYNIEDNYVDILVCDFSQLPFRPGFILDAVITDLPYGIRESSSKVGAKRPYIIPDECLTSHIPSKIDYHLEEILQDLLKFSANNLKLGGRLVFCAFKNDTVHPPEEKLRHDCLKIISISEQSMSMNQARLFICMEKIKQPDNSVPS